MKIKLSLLALSLALLAACNAQTGAAFQQAMINYANQRQAAAYQGALLMQQGRTYQAPQQTFTYGTFYTPDGRAYNYNQTTY